MSKQRIIGGMIDKTVEIFEDIETRILYCSHDMRQTMWPNFPSNVMEMIKQDMLNNPKKLEHLAKWPNLRQDQQIKQYTLCNFGGLDDSPDFDEDGTVHRSEFYDCGRRGVCKFEGKICDSIQVKNGYLTKAELEVLRYIRLPDKSIAEKLNRSPETISTHLQNIREKTGQSDKLNLALFAAAKGITLYKPNKK
ncbi:MULTISPECIES: helix-turn-helix transcriptional regulator [Sphingobacterium]|uniref:helix-turn-helix transcriptional regulator n=1 Tax=Sphingobacterium TaxID=28453 RepID=UPI00129C4B89|nr:MULTISPECIES: helix-turn-helix transcriptional regulator [Sphingobacterium]